MKILITGADSSIGRDLLLVMRKDPEVMGITRESLDLTNTERVNEVFLKFRPLAVIHADGIDDIEQCEAEPWEALRRNVLTTQNLAMACLQVDAALALVSTNQIFSGQKKGPYTEWDPPDPQNVLGHSKCAAEMVVRNHLKRFHILRTQGLFSRHGSNFVLDVMRSVVENTPLEVSEEEFTQPTWTRDFAAAAARVVRQRIYGTFHLTNTGERNGVSMSAWARKILEVGGNHDFPVHTVPDAALGRTARHTPRIVLGNTFYRLQGFTMRSYEEALVAFFDDLAQETATPSSITPSGRPRLSPQTYAEAMGNDLT